MIRRYSYLLFLLLLTFASSRASAQSVFSSLDSLLYYATERSTTLRSGTIKLSQAQKAKLAAALGVFDPSGNVSLNVTNNTKLPVSLFPAEIFGGAPGTYRSVKTGIQYNNTLNQNLEIKLANGSGWQNLKLAKINIDLTGTENKLTRKSLYEDIASAYHNIISLNGQLASTRENVKTSDTLYQIVKNKADEGISRQQDVNDAQATLLSTKESASQLIYSIEQQYIILKILCDIPENEQIVIRENARYDPDKKGPEVIQNNLYANNYQLKERYALQSYRQQKSTLLPYISAFVSNSNQQFSDDFSLLDNNIKWINSNYIGLKLVWQIPTASTVSQLSKAKYDYELAREDAKHSMLQSELDFKQLTIDLEKANSQTRTNKRLSQKGSLFFI